jgi:hypothetical protein
MGHKLSENTIFHNEAKMKGNALQLFSLGMGRQKCVFQVEFDDFEQNLATATTIKWSKWTL